MKKKDVSSFLLAKMYEIKFHDQLFMIGIVVATELSIKSFAFIFLGFCLNFKSTFTIKSL